jgi:hypothetical protein
LVATCFADQSSLVSRIFRESQGFREAMVSEPLGVTKGEKF